MKDSIKQYKKQTSKNLYTKNYMYQEILKILKCNWYMKNAKNMKIQKNYIKKEGTVKIQKMKYQKVIY